MNHSRILALSVACDFIFGANAWAAQTPVHHSTPIQHRTYVTPAAAVSNTADYFGQLDHPYTWPAEKMPLRVYIKPATGVPSYKPEFHEIVERSLQEWSEATNGRVHFSFTDKPAEADVEIEWMRNLPKNKVSHEIGVTEWTKNKFGVIEKTHTILLTVNVDGHEQFGFNVKQAALHELGHVLGIQGHSSMPADIMTLNYHFVVRRNADGTLTPIGGEPQLTTRDKNTIQRMYDDKWLASATAQPAAAVATPAPVTPPLVEPITTTAPPANPVNAPVSTAPPTANPVNATASTPPPTANPVNATASTPPPTANPANATASTPPPTANPVNATASTPPPTANPVNATASTPPPTANPVNATASTPPPTANPVNAPVSPPFTINPVTTPVATSPASASSASILPRGAAPTETAPGGSSLPMLPVTDIVQPSASSATVASANISQPTASTAHAASSTFAPPAASPPASPPTNDVSADLDAVLFGKSSPKAASGSGTDLYTELVRKGIDAIKHGDYDSAITVLRQACSTGNRFSVAEKNLIIALTWKANRLYSNRDYSNAADNYKNAVSLRLKVNGASDPKIAETMPALIYSLRQAGRAQEADRLQSH